MRLIVLILAMLCSAPGFAADVVVKDGNTLAIADVTYRLDGIDAPEFDQLCIDEHADSWTCGIEARDRLTRLIAGRGVHCIDLGQDKTYSKRHMGICSVDGE